jgi:hypothetical protein
LAQTTESVSTPSGTASTPDTSAGVAPKSPDLFSRLAKVWSRLAKVRWRWIEIIGIPIAVVASIGALWEARSTADAVADEQRAVRFVTAEQVLILGPPAPKDEQQTDPPSGFGHGGGVGWLEHGLLDDVPNLVQNYARLPVSGMTIGVDLKYESGEVKTYEIPVGSLPPCMQVGITDHGYLAKTGEARDVQDIVTYVYFVDPTGHKWKRYVGQEPNEVASIPNIFEGTYQTSMIVRTEIQRMDHCG